MNFPKNIGRYKIQSELGRGGMSTVYHALDPRSNREVAIKVLPREMLHDLTFRARFEREIKTLVGLEHPNIVTVYDVGDDNGLPYFVMRYIQGGSLTDKIKQGKLSLQQITVIVQKVAEGLTYAHKKGLIHRDLKPDNILFDNEDNPFISDFGIAKLSNETGDLTKNNPIGSPAYMSPEQAQGQDLDPRSDVYSLGVIIYQMLSGNLPYNAETDQGIAYKHVNEPIPEILKKQPSLPPEIDKVIKTAMAKDKEQRYATAIDLAKALNKIGAGNESKVFAENSSQPLFNKTGIMITGIILLTSLVGLFLLRNLLFTSTPVLAAKTATAEFTAIPTLHPTQTPTAAPILAAKTQPTPSANALAPNCSSETIILSPVIKEIDKFCVKKIPYSTISIPEGAAFESLNPDFSCKIENTRNERSALSCTGKPAFSFDLKVCAAPVFSTNLNKCAQDAVFDTDHECCTAVQPADAGCTTFKVDIRSCP